MSYASLTKDETKALWHAVQNMQCMVRAMRDVAGITPAQIEAENFRLATAKRALRKINTLRKKDHEVQKALVLG